MSGNYKAGGGRDEPNEIGKNERVYQVIQSNLKGYESKQPDNVQQWHTILPDA